VVLSQRDTCEAVSDVLFDFTVPKAKQKDLARQTQGLVQQAAPSLRSAVAQLAGTAQAYASANVLGAAATMGSYYQAVSRISGRCGQAGVRFR
jgi:hypothetical protein